MSAISRLLLQPITQQRYLITNEIIINHIRKIGKAIYQIKRTESPATSLFALTKTLHPVVRRCLFGWPA